MKNAGPRFLPPRRSVWRPPPKGSQSLEGLAASRGSRELEHDVNVSEIYLQLSTRSPRLDWIPEDALSYNIASRPDAVLESDEGRTVIDLLGRSYSRSKIETIWKHSREVTLELW